ncbi:MAG: hypothetical protein ACTSU5_19115 [Promethearchaeota archaeon]
MSEKQPDGSAGFGNTPGEPGPDVPSGSSTPGEGQEESRLANGGNDSTSGTPAIPAPQTSAPTVQTKKPAPRPRPPARQRKHKSSRAIKRKLMLYSDTERKIAQVFYFLLVGFLLWTLVGVVWSVLDYIQPTGKWQDFLQYPTGVQISIFGLMAGLVFLFLVLFAVLYKKGNLMLLTTMFKVQEEAKFETKRESLVAKIITGGILISILVVSAGLVIALFEFALTGGTTTSSSSSLFSALGSLTGGLLFLTIGIICMAFTGLALGFIALWNNGYHFFLNRFFSATYEDDDEYEDDYID